MTEKEAAIQLRESIAKRRARAQEDRDLDSALLMAQLDGAQYVLDSLDAPRYCGERWLLVDQRIEALRQKMKPPEAPG